MWVQYKFTDKRWSISRLNEREEAFLQDIKDSGKEESQSEEDEQLVRQLSPVVLKDEFPS